MEIDKEEFEKFYTNEIETEINNIKKEEKDVKTKALKKECPYLLLICVILYMLGHLWMSFIFILPYILVKLLNVANVDCGTKVFINNLMPKIVKFVDVNLEYIYNGINIEDFKKTCFTRDKIEGFKVTRIDPKSKFASLGLQESDVIIVHNVDNRSSI